MSQEPTNETLLNRPLSISKPQVLEFILLKIKDDTIIYSSRENTQHNNTEAELKTTLQELISEPESVENDLLIHDTQTKLENLETKSLYNTLSKKANFNLLAMNVPAKAFLPWKTPSKVIARSQNYASLTHNLTPFFLNQL